MKPSIASDDKRKDLKVSFGARLNFIHSQRALETLRLNHIERPIRSDFLKLLETKSASALEPDSEFFLCVVLFISCIPSDLDWAVFEPDLLVTSSVDTYIYIWDIK